MDYNQIFSLDGISDDPRVMEALYSQLGGKNLTPEAIAALQSFIPDAGPRTDIDALLAQLAPESSPTPRAMPAPNVQTASAPAQPATPSVPTARPTAQTQSAPPTTGSAPSATAQPQSGQSPAAPPSAPVSGMQDPDIPLAYAPPTMQDAAMRDTDVPMPGTYTPAAPAQQSIAQQGMSNVNEVINGMADRLANIGQNVANPQMQPDPNNPNQYNSTDPMATLVRNIVSMIQGDGTPTYNETPERPKSQLNREQRKARQDARKEAASNKQPARDMGPNADIESIVRKVLETSQFLAGDLPHALTNNPKYKPQ